MPKTLYVGNLPYSMTESSLKVLFETAGTVVAVRVVVDRETQRPKGFGFVEFEETSAADLAIETFAGRNVGGRELVVNEARPREAVGFARR